MADADANEILARDRALLIETVRAAGALALSMFRTEVRNWNKGASSPVSEADIATNDLIEQKLRSATPDYGWLSEESVDDLEEHEADDRDIHDDGDDRDHLLEQLFGIAVDQAIRTDAVQ